MNTLTEAARVYHESLNDEALDYLESRGLHEPEVTDRFSLGVVLEPAIREHENYVGRLSIPYITPSGVVAIRFRCIEDHDCKNIERHHKYMDVSGSGTFMYNVQ